MGLQIDVKKDVPTVESESAASIEPTSTPAEPAPELTIPELQAISAKIDRQLYVQAKHYSLLKKIKFNDLIAIGLKKALAGS